MQALHANIGIKAPIERCFDIVRNIDVHEDTSGIISGKAIDGKTSGLSNLGDETTWSAKFYGIRFSVRTKIIELESPKWIIEERVAGFVSQFSHHYQLTEKGDITNISDTFRVRLPLGFLGDHLLKTFLIKTLKRVQLSRLNAIKRISESSDWKNYIP